MLSLLPSVTLQNFFALLDSRKATLIEPQLLRQLITTPALAVLIIFHFNGRLDLRKLTISLLLRTRYVLFHSSIAHRLVLGHIGPNLHAVQ
jgi:hypothetical protein